RAILWEEADGGKLEKLTIADPGHPEAPPDIVPYPRAGHANAVLRFGITRIASPETVTWVDWDRERMPYVSRLLWQEHTPPTLVVLDRLQKDASVLLVDPATGKTREAIHEHDDAWVNVDPGVPEWLPDGSAFLWKSEHDGDARYGLVPARDPGAVRWLTPAGTQAESLADVDGARRMLTNVGTRDAIHREVVRVPLDAGAPEIVGRTEGGSMDASFTEDQHDVFLGYESSLASADRVLVMSRAGAVLREVPSVAERPRLPTVELTTVGSEAMHVAILRPASWVPGARYPLIDSAYGGPGVQVVEASSRGYLLDQWMADATGAVVVRIDAAGTPGRGRAWERRMLGHLGDVPLDGHIAAIQAIVATHPEIDGSRVGVFGWSFGGYFSALAALRRPDFYRAAVAIAPVTDWRNYDTAYTERYLGLPTENASVYDAASLLTWASRPPPEHEASLLVAHGTADDNVYFLNSLQLVDALAKAGRSFRFTPYLGQTHQFASADALNAVFAAAAETLRAGLTR
ncbi:MAG TPA: prolyl oligopeptidase family serine peptidase, partial [Polyangiaceae bacterium]